MKFKREKNEENLKTRKKKRQETKRRGIEKLNRMIYKYGFNWWMSEWMMIVKDLIALWNR